MRLQNGLEIIKTTSIHIVNFNFGDNLMSASDQFKKNSDVFKSQQNLEQKLNELNSKLSKLMEEDRKSVFDKIYSDTLNYFTKIKFNVDHKDLFIDATYGQNNFEIDFSDFFKHYISQWASFEITLNFAGKKQSPLLVKVTPKLEKSTNFSVKASLEEKILETQREFENYKPISAFKLDLHTYENNRLTGHLASADSVEELFEDLFSLLTEK